MTLCINVLINDDSVYERSEVFSLSLNPLESAHIQLTNSTVLVEILDDEGTEHVSKSIIAIYLIATLEPLYSSHHWGMKLNRPL